MTSTIKVNNVQNQCGANIINESSNTITIGASGDTVTLASGASQTGFGRTGTVNWQTGSIKTGNFTAVNGEGYFCNTSGGAFTATLPASPSAGDIVGFKDYAQTWDSNNVTVARNGSNIEGTAGDATLDAKAQSVTFVYVDSTKGWVLVNEATTAYGAQFVAATGGNSITTVCTNFKVHTFTAPGTFCVTNAGNPFGSNKVDYLVVAGGGGGASQHSGGGGAGGYRTSFPSPGCNAGTTPVNTQAYPITVGGGGAGGPAGDGQCGTTGSNSVAFSITSAGGGGGGSYPNKAGKNGGSGGGAGSDAGAVGSGNTPPVSPPQGNNGGSASAHSSSGGGGGGGGAAAVGGNAGSSEAGPGGAGSQNNIDNNNYYYAGGAGGGNYLPSTPSGAGDGGAGGGGGGGTRSTCSSRRGQASPLPAQNPGSDGGYGPSGTSSNGGAGGANTGGGGGGSGANTAPGGAGGSGIVIIRYKFQ